MLRIHASASAGQAKSYFSTADYYAEGQELVGRWRGEGARRLGLEGDVDPRAWDALCDNTHPETGDRLTLRTKSQRRVGYDINFHVPKSVSVLYALTRDERLLDAFRDSVRETMDEMEREMRTRVRKDARNEDRLTGNMVWGEFVHFTARPVEGLPDPHLHAHCFVFNTTYDDQENVWKAGQFGGLKQDAPYFEAKFHVRLANRLGDLGLAIERTPKGWEVAGLPASVNDKFSRRTREIEYEAERKGITDPDAKAELGAKTRSRKQKDLPLDVLREEWRSRMTDDERDALARVAATIGTEPVSGDATAARRAVELAADHCFERRSVVPERMLLAESLKRAVGGATVKDVEESFARGGFLVKERHGRRMATTTAVLSEEQRMLTFARQGRGTRRAFQPGPHRFQREWLNKGQRNAVEHVLHSYDRVMLIRGAAGVGKTSMMQEAVEAIEATGVKVATFAPSAKASRGVLRDKGFADADTVSRLLVDTALQESLRGQVLWIDEAGLVGSRTMARLFDLAERIDARVILSGDRRQHGSVERGAALRLLEEEAGVVPAEIREIQRQRAEYKACVRDLSEGRVPDAFRALDRLGWIREVADADRYHALAGDYVDTIQAGESALVVSPTHLEAERCTDAIRARLRSAGTLGTEEQRISTLHRADLTEGERQDAASYHAGDVIVFHQNAKGFKKAQRVTVGDEPPPVDHATRFQVFHPGFLDIAEGDALCVTQNGRTADGRGRLHNGDILHVSGFDASGNILTRERKTIARDFGHLAYGYVVTSHASQGTDVDRVFIGQSAASLPASSQEQFYVSVSRGRKQAVVYTDSKPELLEAVRQTDERLSATELLFGDRMPPQLHDRPTHRTDTMERPTSTTRPHPLARQKEEEHER